MDGAVVGATIQVVLQNLLSVSTENISLLLGFKKDLKRLKDSLLMIQDFLSDAEEQQIKNRAVKRWLRNLQAVAFDADNVLDEINYQLLRQRVETQNQRKRKKVQSFFSGSNSFAFRLKMGRKIRDVTKRLEIINQEASSYGLQKRVMDGDAPVVGLLEQTDSFSVDPIVIGRENDVSNLLEMISSCPMEQVFSVIPIVGMGGLGKTTLARLVFNDGQTNRLFKKKIWVCASQDFDAIKLFKMILESLMAQSVQVETREAVLKMLQKNLGGDRYLLVLDDMWNEEANKWHNFVNSLSGISSVKGNVIIVTTRSKKIASIVGTLPAHELCTLTEDHCWSIIKEKSFKGGDVPLEFQMVGKRIAGRCQGLPLMANIVGALLCDKTKEEWLSILETRLSEFGGDENRVLKILKLSFDHLLSSSLKKCFAYCSIFPKDFLIERETLIELWMAEGFLQSNQGNDMETVGHNFFDLLLQNSLFQDVERDDYDKITHCKMHDHVHDLSCSVSEYNHNYVGNSGSDGIPQVPYLAIKMVGDETYVIDNEQVKHVRTLFFEGKVSDNIFLNLKCLRVLTLRGACIKELSDSIGKLIHLRYLDISYTKINYLPDSIGSLYNLQTLWITRDHKVWKLVKLPDTLKNLISLRHLHIHGSTELPPDVGRLTSLQTLKYFVVGHKKGHRIEELGNLNNLRGTLEICGLGEICDEEEAKSAYLFRKANISKLRFVWNESIEGKTTDEKVLEGLYPHPSLKSLEIYGFNGRKFPLWTMRMAIHDEVEGQLQRLDNLVEIRLTNCKRCEEIPTLGHLPHLKTIELSSLTNVRRIGPSFYGIDNCTSRSHEVGRETITIFPTLKRLQLSKMPNLTEWVEPQGNRLVVFPCLEELVVRNCHQLRSVPSHFSCLQLLQIERLESGLLLESICSADINSLKDLRIKDVSGMINLPDGIFVKNQNLLNLEIYLCHDLTHLVSHLGGYGTSLRELRIHNCENLRELPDDLQSLQSLETLNMHNCPSLMSISYPNGLSQGLTSLQRLSIQNCHELCSLAGEMLESSSSLEVLRISECPNLISFPVHLRGMPHLSYLGIFDCPKLRNSPKGIGSLTGLTILEIGPFSEAMGFNSLSETLQGIQELHSLHTLMLYGWPQLDSLPDQLQHLNALNSLFLVDFGIEALPEWFGNFSSLEYLSLYRCEMLRYLPSKRAMQRLNKLNQLWIRDCPLLKERCIRQESGHDDDFEWSKISHIPEVHMDGVLF